MGSEASGPPRMRGTAARGLAWRLTPVRDGYWMAGRSCRHDARYGIPPKYLHPRAGRPFGYPWRRNATIPAHQWVPGPSTYPTLGRALV